MLLNMENKIKDYFENLDPSQLGLTTNIFVTEVKKIGAGASNLNYLVRIGNRTFVFRINADPTHPEKTKREYYALKALEGLGISARAYLLDTSKKTFDQSFLIVDYVEGTSMEQLTEWKTNLSIIEQVGALVATLHSIPFSKSIKIPLGKSRYQNSLHDIREYRAILHSYTQDKRFFKLFDETYASLKKKTPLGPVNPPITLVHSDIQEQNIIMKNGKMTLIDFEFIQRADPAIDVMLAFNDFGEPFTVKQQEAFYKGYFMLREDRSLRTRVQAHLPLRVFMAVLWSIEHAFKIHRKKFSAEFLAHTSLTSHIMYAQTCITRALKAGVLNKKFSDFKVKPLIMRRT